MRHGQTDAEALLWWSLRNRELGVHFRRQHPIGRYIADFACLEHRLIVESDGSQHGGPYDKERDSYLRSVGFVVMRFWSWDVIRDLDGVLDEIAEALDRLRAAPPPEQEPPTKGESCKKGRVVLLSEPLSPLGGVSEQSELVGGRLTQDNLGVSGGD